MQSNLSVNCNVVFDQGGLYHGRIILPAEYPFKPPSFLMLTPSGRFEIGKKICLSISERHPEHWQPSWSMRTALMALVAFLPTKGKGAIGSLVSQHFVYRQFFQKNLCQKWLSCQKRTNGLLLALFCSSIQYELVNSSVVEF